MILTRVIDYLHRERTTLALRYGEVRLLLNIMFRKMINGERGLGLKLV